jgi:rod shape-determining protein MreD
MIMSRTGDPLLLPVKPWFIALSLTVAFALNLLPLGQVGAMPDWLALALVFWNVHQPRRVGIGVAFALGLAMDVHESALLGQHALAYTLLSYFAITIHRRLLWFGVWSQTLQVAPLFFAAAAVMLLVRLAAGAPWPGAAVLAAPLIQALLWPLASWVLLAPQRRPPDPDQNRPL